MDQCGIPRIDNLYQGNAKIQPIVPGDPDALAVGAVHDLLAGHGYSGMPSMAQSNYGTFGPATTKAVSDFCAAYKLPVSSTVEVDSATLQKMVIVSASNPRSSRVYLALALNYAFTGLTKCLCLTSQVEGGGKFAAMSLNTDKAGLSYGLIQWAQSELRLNEILTALDADNPATFVTIFGGDQSSVAKGLLAHVAQPRGGTDAKGNTTDPAYNLVETIWTSRFSQCALSQSGQAVQIKTALNDFQHSYTYLQRYATKITTERQVAFMLDLANQYGDGGAETHYKNHVNDADGDAIIAAIAAAAPSAFQARRKFFLDTDLLCNTSFVTA